MSCPRRVVSCMGNVCRCGIKRYVRVLYIQASTLMLFFTVFTYVVCPKAAPHTAHLAAASLQNTSEIIIPSALRSKYHSNFTAIKAPNITRAIISVAAGIKISCII
ncbi:hypothetical protein E2C01_027711 [Portunus trituberculatus]|uniref:Uncharacterized protein n=1 Tax=Portunus trituberculatus TaxID=210409 RepID=A0A5B7EM20_PORTR|nr:hypothetical protein [Portunus trituberculatus]